MGVRSDDAAQRTRFQPAIRALALHVCPAHQGQKWPPVRAVPSGQSVQPPVIDSTDRHHTLVRHVWVGGGSGCVGVVGGWATVRVCVAGSGKGERSVYAVRVENSMRQEVPVPGVRHAKKAREKETVFRTLRPQRYNRRR